MPDDVDVVAGLTRWLADARVDDAAASRAREHWLRQQLDEEATMAGVLLDLAERGSTVVLRTASGRRARGEITAVAHDFCALRSPEVRDSLHPYSAVESLEPHGSSIRLAGSRPAALDLDLREALTVAAAERPRVLVFGRGSEPTAGELRSVGLDLLVLRPDGAARSAYLPLAAITEVAFA